MANSFSKNIFIAKKLILIARMLVAYNRKELQHQLKRRSDLKSEELEKYLDCLEKMDAKKQKAALFWINKRKLVLPEELKEFEEAMNLIEKQHLDFQKFEKPIEIIEKNDKSTRRIKSQDNHFSPSSEKTFSHSYNAGDGVTIYTVEDSRDGQEAVRKAVDANWGYDKNPWCIIARKAEDGINELEDAWGKWIAYSAYPKRIAFKGEKLIAFSAGDQSNHIEWWDKNNHSTNEIPECNCQDDVSFLKKYGKINLLENPDNFSEFIEEAANKLAKDDDEQSRISVAQSSGTPSEILEELSADKNKDVRRLVARNPKTPVDSLRKLINDKELEVKYAVARNPRLPVEFQKELAINKDKFVRWNLAKNIHTSADALEILSNDEDCYVRASVARNPNISYDTLKKLSSDEEIYVRASAAKNSKSSKSTD